MTVCIILAALVVLALFAKPLTRREARDFITMQTPSGAGRVPRRRHRPY